MTTRTMVWVQMHALDIANAEKAVLSFMAFKAHYDDGTAAWPGIKLIARACGLSRRTVQRSIISLVEKGYLELGVQQFAAFDPRTGRTIRADRRSVVWNVICRDPGTEVEPVEDPDGRVMRNLARQAQSIRREREQAAATDAAPDTDANDACTPQAERDRQSEREERGGEEEPDKMSPRETEARPRETGQNVRQTGQNVTRKTMNNNYPSAPTGHLPADGETPDGKDSIGETWATLGDGPDATEIDWSDQSASSEPAAGPSDGEHADTAGTPDAAARVLDRLEAERAARGLTPRPRRQRDLTAVQRLLDRLRETGDHDPAATIAARLPGILDTDWGAKRADTGQHLASRWAELADEASVDARIRARRAKAGALDPAELDRARDQRRRTVKAMAQLAMEPYREVFGPMVCNRIAGDIAQRILDGLVEDSSQTVQAEAARLVKLHAKATSANAAAEAEARAMAERQDALDRQRLAEMRRRNGGSLFIGARQKTHAGGPGRQAEPAGETGGSAAGKDPR